ncbi:putative CRM domain-containing protein [Apostasia shenzhenica]|uniref:Putative CRM domain-containing protein n=1 Tax=Apostasia shenzhenica TaxID=1088818 RepID=A0A2I0A4M6_9ASPA|nr:putative CRM domain-containing protein [Apostasia shenzhenica]
MVFSSRLLCNARIRSICEGIFWGWRLESNFHIILRNSWSGFYNGYCTTSNHTVHSRPSFTPMYNGPNNRSWKLNLFASNSICSFSLQKSVITELYCLQRWQPIRFISNALVSVDTNGRVARFSLGEPCGNQGGQAKGIKKTKKKMSRKAKRNELKWYRLKAKKKMKSPNPEVRIRYKLEKAKRKEEWLIEKLRKFEMPKAPEPEHDPEILTEEERFYLKRIGEKKKNYVPVGRRGVFGGVVLNMHLHWKKHETVKVICKPCRLGQVHEFANELTRLSKGTVIDIKADNTILFYRGKNYVQPQIMSPPDTLSKQKALEKYRFEQSLEHTSQFIEKLEKELEDYHQHIALYKKNEGISSKSSEEVNPE